MHFFSPKTDNFTTAISPFFGCKKAVSHYLIEKLNAGTIKDFERWIKVYNVYEVIVYLSLQRVS